MEEPKGLKTKKSKRLTKSRKWAKEYLANIDLAAKKRLRSAKRKKWVWVWDPVVKIWVQKCRGNQYSEIARVTFPSGGLASHERRQSMRKKTYSMNNKGDFILKK
jgi:hypothetical protein